MFCRTRHGADRLTKQLSRAGASAAAIHGGRTQPQRERALRSFAAGDVAVLVATDVAARGVHVDDVAAVIHFDLPADGATYVHRSGRTARAGASGTVVTFVDPSSTRDATALQREVGITVPIGAVDFDHLAAPTAPAPPTVEPARPKVEPAPSEVEPVPPEVEPVRGRGRGTVKFFHGRRGYGFIASSADGELFVHHRNLPRDVKIAAGQAVEFDVRRGLKGLEAFDVQLVAV